MHEDKKSASAILRVLVKGLITEQKVLAQCNAKLIFEKYPVIDKACRGIYKHLALNQITQFWYFVLFRLYL